MIIIGSARHDENGRYVNGKPGDQKQKINSDGYDMSGEVSTQAYYVPASGWDVARAKNHNLANGLAFSMALACVNPNIGYSQSTRYGVVNEGILTPQKVNADCSSLVRACLQNCGYKIGDFNTANELQVLLATGLFEKKTGTTLYNGDILITKKKGHTAIVVSGAKPRELMENECSYPEPTSNLKKGDRGDEVKWVQWHLNKSWSDLEIDGKFGPATEIAVRAFQKMHAIEVDGIVGRITRNKINGR